MFDGDNAGLRASYKAALMALQFLSPEKFLQFIKLPNNYDPDSFINEHSLLAFKNFLKKPISIVNFIFEQSSSTIDLKNADNKISFDKYIDDIISSIKDKKIQYFYKNEFKTLFFQKIKSLNSKNIKKIKPTKVEPLIQKQINSFIAAYINHENIRDELKILFNKSELLSPEQLEFIKYFQDHNLISMEINDIKETELPHHISDILNVALENSLYQLFPYAQKGYDSKKTLIEIQDSVKNLKIKIYIKH